MAEVDLGRRVRADLKSGVHLPPAVTGNRQHGAHPTQCGLLGIEVPDPGATTLTATPQIDEPAAANLTDVDVTPSQP